MAACLSGLFSPVETEEEGEEEATRTTSVSAISSLVSFLGELCASLIIILVAVSENFIKFIKVSKLC